MLANKRLEEWGRSDTYSSEQSCMTLPFFRPRIWSLEGSGISEVDTRVGPITD